MILDEVLSSDIFKAIINSIYSGIIVIDRECKIVVFNDAASKIGGVKRKDALSRPVREIIPNTGLIDVLEKGETQVGEKIVFNNHICVSHRAPIFYKSEIWGAVGIFHDVSDLEKITKELESYTKLVDELNEIRKELELIIESSNDGLYITDGKGITLRVNSTYEEITGIKAHEVVGRHMKELVDEGFFSESVTLHVLGPSKPQSVTRLQTLRNGRHVISTGRPVFDRTGNIYRVITNVRDVTPFLNLTKELENAKKHLEKYQLELEHIGGENVVIRSKQMIHVLEMVKQVAPYPTTVLITGESGVGKEIVARLIHSNSSRKKGPFIKVNCGAIPDNLLESELFGYEPGAFTGATKKGKPGLVELADKGTIFLDEISELALELQVKLLRVIQDQEIVRLGGTSTKTIDVRIVAATNKSLLGMVEDERFRADLYYRLNVVRIDIPPLRQRRDVIPSLVIFFLKKFCHDYGLSKEISTEAMQCLFRYDWPGNIRELKNVIENMVVMVKEGTILPEHLPDEIEANRPASKDRSLTLSRVMPIKEATREVERQLIELALRECGSIRKTAKALGIAHSTLLRKISTLQ